MTHILGRKKSARISILSTAIDRKTMFPVDWCIQIVFLIFRKITLAQELGFKNQWWLQMEPSKPHKNLRFWPEPERKPHKNQAKITPEPDKNPVFKTHAFKEQKLGFQKLGFQRGGRHALLKRDQTWGAKCKVVINLLIRRHDLEINLELHLHLS